MFIWKCNNANRFSVRGRFRVRGYKILFGQYKSNISQWKVPTIHRNKHVCVCVCVFGDVVPSSMLTCMASLALFGTLNMTSSPSLISPLPSSQQESSSCKHTYCTEHYTAHRTQRLTFSKQTLNVWETCGTLSSSWYLVILCTGLIRYDDIELTRPCLFWISCSKQTKIHKWTEHHSSTDPLNTVTCSGSVTHWLHLLTTS